MANDKSKSGTPKVDTVTQPTVVPETPVVVADKTPTSGKGPQPDFTVKYGPLKFTLRKNDTSTEVACEFCGQHRVVAISKDGVISFRGHTCPSEIFLEGDK